MSVETLITTMTSNPKSILKEMKIKSDALIGLQGDKNYIESFSINEYSYKAFHFRERGVGLNRNNLLMRSKAKINIFADDDLVYEDNYVEIIANKFKSNPNLDVAIFNLKIQNKKKLVINKNHSVNYFNFMKYGTARIAIRRERVTKHGIYFNTHFGGGTKFGSGEDTLFLKHCLDKKLNIKAFTDVIGRLEEKRPSTWFVGYNDKYFFDKGALFAAISRRFSKFLCLQFVIRHRKTILKNRNLKSSFKIMLQGISAYNKI